MSTAATESIRLCGIKKTYRGSLALEISELVFQPGKCYALIGRNGSGKSTLLRILAGTLAPDAGSVFIPAELTAERGYLPQTPYIFACSALKNVLMALPKGEKTKTAGRRALAEVDAEHLAAKKGGAMSGGERQRVAFARMLVRSRRLILLDEPTAALDLDGARLAEEALLRRRAAGCTLIVVTHSLIQAKRIADEALLLADGRLILAGDPEIVAASYIE